MLQWFNKKGDGSSVTAASLTQETPLKDDDYEFLFNQLLDGVAHGWHLGRIIKFFELLEPRGSIPGWIAWFEQFETRVIYSNDPAKRRIGAIMMRLGELIQSREELQQVATISHRIGKKLYIGNVAELIWEYDGVDTVVGGEPGPSVLSEDQAEPAEVFEQTPETVIESVNEPVEPIESAEPAPVAQAVEPIPANADVDDITETEAELDEIVNRAFEAFSQSGNLSESPEETEQIKSGLSDLAIDESESSEDSDREQSDKEELSTEEIINQAFEAGISAVNSANSSTKDSAADSMPVVEELEELIDLAPEASIEDRVEVEEELFLKPDVATADPELSEAVIPQEVGLKDEQLAEIESLLDESNEPVGETALEQEIVSEPEETPETPESSDQAALVQDIQDQVVTEVQETAQINPESAITPEEVEFSPSESLDKEDITHEIQDGTAAEDSEILQTASEPELAAEETDLSSRESLSELSDRLTVLQNDILEDQAGNLASTEAVNAPFAVASFLEAAKTLVPEGQNQSKTNNLTWEEFIAVLEQDEVLARQVAQYLEIDSSSPQDIIQAAVERFTYKQQNQLEPATIELVESWFHLGLKQASAEDFQGAIASWEKALKLNPNLSEAWHNRGSALGRLGQYEVAIQSFDKAIELTPERYQAWNDRAHALYQLQKWQQAVESWDKAIAVTPDNYQFWYNRGCALEQLESIDESVASYEKALEIKPDFQPARKRYISLIKETPSPGSN